MDETPDKTEQKTYKGYSRNMTCQIRYTSRMPHQKTPPPNPPRRYSGPAEDRYSSDEGDN